VVSALKHIGCSVLSLAAVGGGVPDLLVGYGAFNILLEIKHGDKSPSRRQLTPDQVDWHRGWLGQKAIIYSAEEAIEYVRNYERTA
jgi:hypothetical protein